MGGDISTEQAKELTRLAMAARDQAIADGWVIPASENTTPEAAPEDSHAEWQRLNLGV